MSLIALVLLGREAWWYHRFLGLACGYAAKVACSCVLIGGRDLESVQTQELEPFGVIDVSVDREAGTATASAFGIWTRTARYREGIGATLVHGEDVVLRPERLDPPRGPSDPDAEWPAGRRVAPARFDTARLDAAVARAFDEPDPERPRRTRAFVVVHRGRIVAERYADGFGPAVPQHGWSMTKSVVNALIGVLVQSERLQLSERAPVPEWQDAIDGRNMITVDELLRMESGLAFDESYEDPSSDALQMLFGSDDMAAYAASLPRTAPRDVVWSYSSGASVLLARVVRSVAGDADAPAFARDALFTPLGMATARIEPDAAGTLVGSSMAWASARDWARFGLLYLRDGVWNGRRILPEGWVGYSTTPTPNAPEGRFGAHFWLNAGDATGARTWPSLPPDLFWAAGFQGQYVIVAPSQDAVIVRLGQSVDSGTLGIEATVRDVLDALP